MIFVREVKRIWGLDRAPVPAATLTEAEREALWTASHTVEPIHKTGEALFAAVERILAARQPATVDAVHVEVEQQEGQPTSCKVWRGDVLVFDGLDRSASAVVPAPEGEMRILCQRCGRPVETLAGHFPACPPAPEGGTTEGGESRG